MLTNAPQAERSPFVPVLGRAPQYSWGISFLSPSISKSGTQAEKGLWKSLPCLTSFLTSLVPRFPQVLPPLPPSQVDVLSQRPLPVNAQGGIFPKPSANLRGL